MSQRCMRAGQGCILEGRPQPFGPYTCRVGCPKHQGEEHPGGGGTSIWKDFCFLIARAFFLIGVYLWPCCLAASSTVGCHQMNSPWCNHQHHHHHHSRRPQWKQRKRRGSFFFHPPARPGHISLVMGLWSGGGSAGYECIHETPFFCGVR